MKGEQQVSLERITRIDDAIQHVQPSGKLSVSRKPRAGSLLIEVPTVTMQTSSEAALQILLAHPELHMLPVLEGKHPVGLLGRSLVDKFSHGYVRDLYSRKPCATFMDSHPLIANVELTIVDLSQMVINKGFRHFGDGFILVRDGVYAGVGTNFDLMQAITQQQLQEARYANPLTLLPGNVPINEQMQLLLDQRLGFWAVYADLDCFKPFNDAFGYGHGDALIKLTADLLVRHADLEADFVGHIGGDDFFILFRSENWEERCQQLLADFDRAVAGYAHQKALGDRVYMATDRRGQRVEYVFPTLSLGVVPVADGQFDDMHEIVERAAEVKKAAKMITGSSLYVDRRGKIAIPDMRAA